MVNHKEKLNPKHEKFCQLYATDKEFFGNGVESYMEAYDIPRYRYNSALAGAGRLLVNSSILARINELLDIKLSNEIVDKELAFVVLQKKDLSSKVAAIKEFNRVKKRVDDAPKTLLIGSIIQRLDDQRENSSRQKLETAASLLDSGQKRKSNPIQSK